MAQRLALVLLLPLLIGGCAGNILDLLPEPDPDKLEVTITGKVADATDTASPIAGARVKVRGTWIPLDTVSRDADDVDRTDADGRFTVNAARGYALFEVDDAAGFTAFRLFFDLGQHTDDVRLDVTLVPRDRTFKSVEIAPTGPLTVAPGEQQQFSATVLDVDGDPLPDVTPTWATAGDIGVVDASGLFTAGADEFTGSVIAALSSKQTTVQVKVETPAATGATLLPGRLPAIDPAWVGRG